MTTDPGVCGVQVWLQGESARTRGLVLVTGPCETGLTCPQPSDGSHPCQPRHEATQLAAVLVNARRKVCRMIRQLFRALRLLGDATAAGRGPAALGRRIVRRRARRGLHRWLRRNL